MAQQPPVFTDPGAYARPNMGTPMVANNAPVYEAVGEVANAGMKLAKVFYEQDQDKAVLDAKLGMAEGFQALRQKVAGETDYRKLDQLFDDEAAKIQQAATQNVMDGKTQQTIGAEFRAASMSAQADVFKRSTALRGSEYIATSDRLNEQLYQSAPLDGQLDPTLAASKAQIKEDAVKMQRNGYLTADQAQNRELANLRRLDDGLATWDVKNMPQQAVALLEANKDGEWLNYKDLDVKRREALISQAKAGGRKDAANVNELQDQAVGNIWEGKGNGAAQVKEAYARGMEGSRAQDFEGNVQAAQQAKSVLDKMRFSPLDTWETQLSQFEQDASKVGNEYLPKQARALRDYAASLGKKWIDAPAATADQEFPLPAHPEGKEWPLGAKMSQRLAAYEAVGVANQGDKQNVPARQRLLTDQELMGNITALKNQPPQGKAQMMASLKDEMGPYAAVGVGQLRKYGELNIAYDRMSDADVSPTGVQVLALTAEAKEADLAKVLPDPTNDRKNITKMVQEAFQAGPGMTFQTRKDEEDALEMTTKAALYYGRDNAGTAPGRAMKDIWGKTEQIGTARLPVGLTPPQKENVRYALEDATRNVERFKPYMGATPLGEYRRRIGDEGRWYTYTGAGGKDEGVELVWMDVTQVDTSGKPIRMSFADMASTAAPDKNAQQSAALADPRTRARLAIGGRLPPTPGAR